MSPQQLVRSDFTPTYSHFTPHTFNRSVSPLWFELEFKLQINLGSPRSHQIPWCVLFLRIAISLLEKEVSHIFYSAALLQTDKTAAETAMTMKWKWQCRNWAGLRCIDLSFFLQRIKRPLQRLLDHAKANIDVIDFRNPQKEVRNGHIMIFTDCGEIPFKCLVDVCTMIILGPIL